MRLLLVLLILLLVSGLVVYLKPEYKSAIRDLSSAAGLTQIVPKKTARLYKWRDAKGHWQISDQPPPAAVDYERLEYREDLNVLPRPPKLQGQ